MNRIRFELKSQFTPKDKRIDGIRLKPKSDRLFESPKGEKKMFFTHSILGADGFLNVLAQVPRGPACLWPALVEPQDSTTPSPGEALYRRELLYCICFICSSFAPFFFLFCADKGSSRVQDLHCVWSRGGGGSSVGANDVVRGKSTQTHFTHIFIHSADFTHLSELAHIGVRKLVCSAEPKLVSKCGDFVLF